MDQKQRNRWEKIRSRGRRNFVLLHGMLLWGLSTGVLWFGVTQFFMPQSPWLLRAFLALILFPLGGILWGTWVWKSAEKKFLEPVAAGTKSAAPRIVQYRDYLK